jgi:ATP-dependent Zn protease
MVIGDTMTSQINKVSKKAFRVYELISTAYHEAGHTLYALLCSMKVNHVYVFEHKIFKRIHGFTQYESHAPEKDSVDFIPMLEQEIGLSYAGLLAEKHHFKSISGTDQVPMFIKEGSSDDLSAIRKMLQKHNIVPAGKKRYAYKQKVARKTTAILVEHWDAVDVIAHALFKHKRLNYQDLKQLLITKTNNKKFWRDKFKDIESIFPL